MTIRFLRLGMGALFVFAGALKLIHPLAFLRDLTSYEFWPESFVWMALTWFLPTLEIVLGAALIIDVWAREASTLLIGLMIIFALALLIAWTRGLSLSCGCFGPLNWGDSYPFWVVRDLMLLALLLMIYRNER